MHPYSLGTSSSFSSSASSGPILPQIREAQALSASSSFGSNVSDAPSTALLLARRLARVYSLPELETELLVEFVDVRLVLYSYTAIS